mmetsp:Transcript_31993/g.74976  ORF Transcript_31993/g.74976 Transcript_31993/m.74976 type:complete len:270 (+) Transcript_31993:416-1225(+)
MSSRMACWATPPCRNGWDLFPMLQGIRVCSTDHCSLLFWPAYQSTWLLVTLLLLLARGSLFTGLATGMSSSAGNRWAMVQASGAHCAASHRSSAKRPSASTCASAGPKRWYGGKACAHVHVVVSPTCTPMSIDLPSVVVRNFRNSLTVVAGTSSRQRTTTQHLFGNLLAAAVCREYNLRLSRANHALFPRICSPLSSLAASPSAFRILGSQEITRIAGNGATSTTSYGGSPAADAPGSTPACWAAHSASATRTSYTESAVSLRRWPSRK